MSVVVVVWCWLCAVCCGLWPLSVVRWLLVVGCCVLFAVKYFVFVCCLRRAVCCVIFAGCHCFLVLLVARLVCSVACSLLFVV